MLEKAVEEIVKRYPREVFPDLELTFVEGQRRLAGGNILDVRFRDEHDVHWIIELKRAHITLTTLDQLGRYVDQLRATEPGTRVEGMAVGFSIDATVATSAAARGLHVRLLDEGVLRTIAERHGVAVDHESGYRPKLAGTNRTPRVTRQLGGRRPEASPEATALVRALDARFPPGSLDGSAAIATLEEYWRLACPAAPASHQKLAADLSQTVLVTAAGTAIATRSQSVSDPYTTVRAGDGRVAAAIDARRDYVKLDFPLPPDLADELRRERVLTIWNPRGYSVWVQSRVSRGLVVERAHELLRLGLNWEFKGMRS